jgi:hypothetical protein
MEIKLATFNFKRDENRKYDQIVRRLNKPNADIPRKKAYSANGARVRFASRNAMLPSRARS